MVRVASTHGILGFKKEGRRDPGSVDPIGSLLWENINRSFLGDKGNISHRQPLVSEGANCTAQNLIAFLMELQN